jgi:hypothetical protein
MGLMRYVANFAKFPTTMVGPCTYSEAYDEAAIHFPHIQCVSWLVGTHLPLTGIVRWTQDRYGESAVWTHPTEPDDDPRPYVVDITRDWAYFDREFMFRSANAAMEFKMRWL